MFLDWFLFGNGHGMGSPFFDDVFYWLKDLSRFSRGKAPGNFYRWSFGFGAQMHSYEWFAPPAGTRRKLFGHEFVVFQVKRRWVRVEVSWALARPPETAEAIREIHRKLQNWGLGR